MLQRMLTIGITVAGVCKLLWNQFWRLLKKLKMAPPYDHNISLLNMHPESSVPAIEIFALHVYYSKLSSL